MRCYTGQHQYYCGVDLHARTLYLCVLDDTGTVRLHIRDFFKLRIYALHQTRLALVG